ELAEPAVAMDSEHLQLAADVRPSHRAGMAAAAADHGIDGHELAHARGGNAAAHHLDAADELVADDPGIGHERVVTLQAVQAGPAAPAVAHAQAHLARSRLGPRPLHHGQAAGLFDHDAAHQSPMSRTTSSAIAGEEVSPGESMPMRFTKPGR